MRKPRLHILMIHYSEYRHQNLLTYSAKLLDITEVSNPEVLSRVTQISVGLSELQLGSIISDCQFIPQRDFPIQIL
jgi:hypothetical protein